MLEVDADFARDVVERASEHVEAAHRTDALPEELLIGALSSCLGLHLDGQHAARGRQCAEDVGLSTVTEADNLIAALGRAGVCAPGEDAGVLESAEDEAL